MVDWAIAEVRYKAEVFKRVNCIEALDGVWKSDTIVSNRLKLQLQAAVKSLEDVPEVSHMCNPAIKGFVSRFRCNHKLPFVKVPLNGPR